MLGARVFEKQYLLIGGGQNETVPDSPGENTSILKVGAPSDEDGAGFDGICVTVAFVVRELGAETDSDIVVTAFRSFDGVTVDDASFDQFTILTAEMTEFSVWVKTVMYPVAPRDSGQLSCGYAMRVNLVRDSGDRTVYYNVYRRRWRWKAGL